MRPRRTLPTIWHQRPLWWRLGRELVRRLVIWWAQYRRRCVVEEERGYRTLRRIGAKGFQLGKEYMHNCRQQRRELRDKIANWNR